MRRRAVNESQKHQRRQAILDVALRLFRENGYEAITMNQVAEASGLAKGTLYLYFRTKEALFLALLQDDLQAWFQGMEHALARIEKLDPESFIAHIADSLSARPHLLRLAAILHTVLERNIELETARDFKYALAEGSQRIGALLDERLDFLAPGEGLRLLLRIHALIIGLQHMAEPAPVVRQVLADPALSAFNIDFRAEFLDTLALIVRGLAARSASHV